VGILYLDYHFSKSILFRKRRKKGKRKKRKKGKRKKGKRKKEKRKNAAASVLGINQRKPFLKKRMV
jgi:hypothetical protein